VIEPNLSQRGEEEKEAAELGADCPWFEAQGPNIGAIGRCGLGAWRTLGISAPRQFCEPLLAEDLAHGGRSPRDPLFLEGFTDVVDGLVLLAEFNDSSSNGVVGLDPWARRVDEELAVGLTPELVHELLECPVGVTEASCDLGTGETIDEIGPESFVLAVCGVTGSPQKLS
jgi:hypothetical protein